MMWQKLPSIPLNARVPYWMVGDVMLTTGIRDGVNLLPMEYCVARNVDPGVLIIRYVWPALGRPEVLSVLRVCVLGEVSLLFRRLRLAALLCTRMCD